LTFERDSFHRVKASFIFLDVGPTHHYLGRMEAGHVIGSTIWQRVTATRKKRR